MLILHLRSSSIQLKNPNRLKILSRFSSEHVQFKNVCAISKNRSENNARKKSWNFSTFLANYLNWNFNSQVDFVLIQTTFLNMALRQQDARWTLSRIFLWCYMQFSFSKTVLSARQSTAASLATTWNPATTNNIRKRTGGRI